ncbi:hypothetical protein BH20ACI1_BH20ACI1_10680 [soil metagenome]
MKFTWKKDKAKKVSIKHKVEFDKLTDVFDDAFSVDFIDDEHSTEDETRYAIIGKAAEYGLIYLVYEPVGENDLKFITARRAEKWMVRFYKESNRRF